MYEKKKLRYLQYIILVNSLIDEYACIDKSNLVQTLKKNYIYILIKEI